MSISSELILLNNTKQGIKTAINNKGVSVTNEAFAVYPDKVRLIPNGGGVYESSVILFIEGRLKSLVIPENTVLRPYACAGGSYTSVTIPNSVTSIPKNAFYACGYLTDVSIGTGVTSIGNNAFASCSSLSRLVIPDSVTTIGDDCCYFAPVSYVEIGTGITSIGKRAFSHVYNGTVVVKATVPPTIPSSDIPFGSQSNIYVPDNSVLDYQVAWSYYADRIKPISQLPS